MGPMERITNHRHLSSEEAAKYKLIREQVEEELPDLIDRHHKRLAKKGQIMADTKHKSFDAIVGFVVLALIIWFCWPIFAGIISILTGIVGMFIAWGIQILMWAVVACVVIWLIGKMHKK